MNHSCNTTCKNHESLYLGLGIMSNRDSEKSSTKYRNELIVFDPGNAGYGVSESPISKHFRG